MLANASRCDCPMHAGKAVMMVGELSKYAQKMVFVFLASTVQLLGFQHRLCGSLKCSKRMWLTNRSFQKSCARVTMLQPLPRDTYRDYLPVAGKEAEVPADEMKVSTGSDKSARSRRRPPREARQAPKALPAKPAEPG